MPSRSTCTILIRTLREYFILNYFIIGFFIHFFLIFIYFRLLYQLRQFVESVRKATPTMKVVRELDSMLTKSGAPTPPTPSTSLSPSISANFSTDSGSSRSLSSSSSSSSLTITPNGSPDNLTPISCSNSNSSSNLSLTITRGDGSTADAASPPPPTSSCHPPSITYSSSTSSLIATSDVKIRGPDFAPLYLLPLMFMQKHYYIIFIYVIRSVDLAVYGKSASNPHVTSVPPSPHVRHHKREIS